MGIAIVYCETLAAEIEALAGGFPEITHLEPMPWRLHIDPEELLREVRRAIARLQDEVDAVVLGYGRCQCLDRLGNGFGVPVLRVEAEDCIGVLLGQERYEAELRAVPGTWFLSPGWTRMGTDFVFHELQLHHLKDKGREIDPLQLARRMLEGFSRALFIDVALPGRGDGLFSKAARIAADLGLNLESTPGSCRSLRDLLEQARRIAAAAGRRGGDTHPLRGKG